MYRYFLFEINEFFHQEIQKIFIRFLFFDNIEIHFLLRKIKNLKFNSILMCFFLICAHFQEILAWLFLIILHFFFVVKSSSQSLMNHWIVHDFKTFHWSLFFKLSKEFQTLIFLRIQQASFTILKSQTLTSNVTFFQDLFLLSINQFVTTFSFSTFQFQRMCFTARSS